MSEWSDACIKAQAELIRKLKREIINLKAKLSEYEKDNKTRF